MAIDANSPIGIFDSGIGGLTVAHAIAGLLPFEQILYFGDTAHLPYGDKSPEAVLHYSEHIAEFLVEKGCKMIVIACNTASSVAFETLQEKYADHIPVINVVDPVVKGVAESEHISKVGVIGTKATIGSDIYARKLKELNPDLIVNSLATPLLAPMIEAGFFNNTISKEIIKTYLDSPELKGIDAMVLACTHYPLIRHDIEEIYHRQINIVDSTDFVAREVQRILGQQNMLSERKSKKHHFYVSDYTEAFERTTKFFYTEPVHLERFLLWDY